MLNTVKDMAHPNQLQKYTYFLFMTGKEMKVRSHLKVWLTDRPRKIRIAEALVIDSTA